MTHILDRTKAILQDRRKDYDPTELPFSNFETIAKLWTVTLGASGLLPAGKKITPEMVATLMIQMKIARYITGGYKEDTFVDIIGYATRLWEIKNNK